MNGNLIFFCVMAGYCLILALVTKLMDISLKIRQHERYINRFDEKLERLKEENREISNRVSTIEGYLVRKKIKASDHLT